MAVLPICLPMFAGAYAVLVHHIARFSCRARAQATMPTWLIRGCPGNRRWPCRWPIVRFAYEPPRNDLGGMSFGGGAVISETQFGELIAILGRIAVGLERMAVPGPSGTRSPPPGPAAVPIYPSHWGTPGMLPSHDFVPTPITMVEMGEVSPYPANGGEDRTGQPDKRDGGEWR